MLSDAEMELRRGGIGASEAAAAIGLSKFRTPAEVWLQKTGRTKPDPHLSDPGTPPWWGLAIEPVLADLYSLKRNVRLRRRTTLTHKEYPWLLATPDREIVGKQMLLECKTSMPWRSDWGDEGTDEVPKEYIVQCHQQMYVRGWTENGCDLILFRHIGDSRIYHIEFNHEFWALCLTKLKAFWELVQQDTEPQYIETRDLQLLYPADHDNTLLVTDDIEKVYMELVDLRRSLKVLEQAKEHHENLIKEQMESCGRLVNDEMETLATWRAPKPTTTHKLKPLIEDLRQLNNEEVDAVLKQHEYEKQNSRRFLVKEDHYDARTSNHNETDETQPVTDESVH